MTSERYQYLELDAASRQIRLAHIEPGAWDDPISCDLHLASLNASPTYETLSYVWGDQKITKPIALGGCDFPVTINLHGALRRLRAKAKTRIIWIDALCIDQKNNAERAQQVALMGAIFKSCQQVLIWLGDSNEDIQTIEEGRARLRDYLAAWEDIEDTKGREQDMEEKWDGNDEGVLETSTALEAFALLHDLSDNKHMHELPCFTIEANSMLVIAEGYKRAFDALQRITEMPYWRRIWVVQEILLSPLATVVWGSISAPWKIFVDAAMNFEKHIHGCCLEHNNSPGFYFHTLATFHSQVSTIESPRIDRQAGLDLPILKLLNLYFDREATVPQDKVYGIYGLVMWQGESCVEPNYDMPTDKLCEDVTLYIINSTKSLHVLVGDCVHHIDFPSWVANWGQKAKAGIWEWDEWKYDVIRSNRYYHYAATTMDVTPQAPANSMLNLAGTRVDTIVAASTLISFKTWEDQLRICKQILSWIKDSDRDYVKAFGSVGIWEDFYWRFLCGDVWQLLETGGICAHRRIQNEDRGAYELWKKGIFDERQQIQIIESAGDNPRFQCFHQSVCGTIANRRFFVTREGYLGLGPNALQIGDEVYVVNGSRVPFVLRKADRANLERQPEDENRVISSPMLRLIGDCYVHGIMDEEMCRNGRNSAVPFVLC